MADAEGTEAQGSRAGGIMAIRLVLQIMEELAKQESVGVTQLARALDTTKARVFRHLRTLLAEGYAVQDPGTDRYSAGSRLLALSRVVGMGPYDTILRLARPALVRLRKEFGQTVNFSIVLGDSVSIVETLPGSSLIGVVMQSNDGMPLHATAAGKLLLAELVAKGQPVDAEPLERFTSNTITDPAALVAEFDQIRKQGWAAAPEEFILGINALSAPVRDHSGDVVAMISLFSSIHYITRQPAPEMIEGVRRAAAEVTEVLSL